jgi:hypothetical protein
MTLLLMHQMLLIQLLLRRLAGVVVDVAIVTVVAVASTIFNVLFTKRSKSEKIYLVRKKLHGYENLQCTITKGIGPWDSEG